MKTTLIIDIVAILILVISIIVGAKQGFSKTFINSFGCILSLILAVLLCSTTATFLQDRFSLVTKISSWLGGTIRNIFGEVVETPISTANEVNLSEGGLALWLIRIVLQVKTDVVLDETTTVNSIITPVFGYYIVLLISLLILYILFRILLFLFSKMIKSLYVIKLVKYADRLLGFALGAIRGVIIVQVIILILGFIPVSFCQAITTEIPNCIVTNIINGTNIFALIINNLSLSKVTSLVSNLFK